jgi:arabinofuranosyltransferase
VPSFDVVRDWSGTILTARGRTLLAVVFVAAGLAAWAVSPVVFDDAFISYRYAANLVDGHGLVFNPGDRVEGFTNLLWVLIAAAAISLGADPFLATRALGLAAYLGCGLMTLSTSLSFSGGSRQKRTISIVLLSAILVSTRGAARLAGSGLETFFVAACLLGAGVLYHFGRRTPRRDLLGSALALAAVLTRLDAALGLGASIIATASEPRTAGAIGRLARRYVVPLTGILALGAWRFAYYGTFVPNSYHAKDAGGWHLGPGLMYVAGYLLNSPYVALLLSLAAFGLRSAWHTRWRSWQVFLCAFYLLHTVYAIKVGGDFMHYRFMFEALPFLICGAAVGLALLPARAGKWPVLLAGFCLALSVSPSYLERSYVMQSLWEMNSYARTGREAGTRLKALLPQDTIIATTLSGTIPYYSKLPVVDQWGINDAFVARLPAPSRFARGHLKSAPLSYLRERQVNLVINHPTVCSCSNPCTEGGPEVFIRLSRDRCLRATYLVPQTQLTRYLCGKPTEFVLRNISCN